MIKIIIAFVGTMDDESETPISGTGKTGGMTGFGYLDYLAGNKIYSNYHTEFSTEVIGFQAMITKFQGKHSPNVKFLVSEMQTLLNSLGSYQEQILFIDSFSSQLRKHDIDIYYDTQRFANIHKRLRVHTDVILIPFKTHFDNEPCYYNNCKKPHKVFIFSQKPYKEEPLTWEIDGVKQDAFNMLEVGKLYNSMEIIFDTLDIPKKKKRSED